MLSIGLSPETNGRESGPLDWLVAVIRPANDHVRPQDLEDKAFPLRHFRATLYQLFRQGVLILFTNLSHKLATAINTLKVVIDCPVACDSPTLCG